jgi:hypothetical protein
MTALWSICHNLLFFKKLIHYTYYHNLHVKYILEIWHLEIFFVTISAENWLFYNYSFISNIFSSATSSMKLFLKFLELRLSILKTYSLLICLVTPYLDAPSTEALCAYSLYACNVYTFFQYTHFIHHKQEIWGTHMKMEKGGLLKLF